MKKILEKQLNHTTELINSLPWDNKQFYADYLAQTYYFVCHSTRLLARSISHFPVNKDYLYKHFLAHLKEENYHERLASSDIKNLGYSLDNLPENNLTKAFWEVQYYKNDQSKGIALMGYILYLEGIAVHCFQNAYKTVNQCHGPKASHFIRVHVEEDPEHLNGAIKMIESFSPEEQKLIWENFHQTADMYHAILMSVANNCMNAQNGPNSKTIPKKVA